MKITRLVGEYSGSLPVSRWLFGHERESIPVPFHFQTCYGRKQVGKSLKALCRISRNIEVELESLCSIRKPVTVTPYVYTLGCATTNPKVVDELTHSVKHSAHLVTTDQGKDLTPPNYWLGKDQNKASYITYGNQNWIGRISSFLPAAMLYFLCYNGVEDTGLV